MIGVYHSIKSIIIDNTSREIKEKRTKHFPIKKKKNDLVVGLSVST